MKKGFLKKLTIFILTFLMLPSSVLISPIKSYALTVAPIGTEIIASSQQEETLATKDTRTKSNNGVMDVITEEVAEGSDEAFTYLVSAFIDDLLNAFSPSFFMYRRMTKGLDNEPENAKRFYALDNDNRTNDSLPYDEAMVEDNYIVRNLFNFSQRFGVAFATVLTLFCLLLCLVGRGEYIRDTPIQVFIKYIVACLLIYFSWSIIMEAITLFGKVWDEFVIKDWTNTNKLSYEYIRRIDTVWMADSIFGEHGVLKDGLGSATYMWWVNLGIKACGIFLKLKLFKNILRLFIEVAERYFVTTIMMFFFPAVVPTIISNSSSNIFHSYVRMFMTNCFLLCVNSLFMKVYVISITAGVFTDDLVGYVAGLAFAKVCFKLDAYLAAMGLNVAQTGGGMMDCFGGALASFTNALRVKDMAQRAGVNRAQNGMEKALANNDYKSYARNAKYSTAMGHYANASEQSFQKSMSQRPNPMQSYASNTVTSNKSTHTDAFNGLGISPVATQSMDAQLAAAGSAGLNARNIDITQIDGPSTLSNDGGSTFKLTDADTHEALGTIVGSEAYLTANNGSNYLSTDDWNSLLGTSNDATTLPERKPSLDTDNYMQSYVASDHDNLTTYSVYDYAAHPEMAGTKDSQLIDVKGHYYVMKSESTPRQVETNPMDCSLDGKD